MQPPRKLTAVEIKRLKLLIWCFIAFLLISLILTLAQRYVLNRALSNYPGFASVQNTNASQQLNLKIEETHFRIPRNYVDSYSASGVLLFILFPDMEPLTKENYNYFMRDVSKNNRRVGIHIKTDKDYPGLDDVFMRVYWQNKATKKLDQRYGLEPIVATDSETIWSLKEQETYALYKNGKVQTFIVCNKEGARPNPGCQQWLIYKGFLVDIQYRKFYLSDWRELLDKCTALIDLFIVNDSTKENGNVQFDNGPDKPASIISK